jgi:hypothetical protein
MEFVKLIKIALMINAVQNGGIVDMDQFTVKKV